MNSGKDWLDRSFVGLEISRIMRDQRLDCSCGLFFDGPRNFRSWAVLVQSSLSLFSVLGLDFQALVMVINLWFAGAVLVKNMMNGQPGLNSKTGCLAGL